MSSLKIKQERRKELVFSCFPPLDLIYSSVGRTAKKRDFRHLGSMAGRPGSVIRLSVPFIKRIGLSVPFIERIGLHVSDFFKSRTLSG